MQSQRHNKLVCYLALSAACLLTGMDALANPCSDKLWVDAPVLALGHGGDQDGIGGTGHASDASDGIGGTGRSAPLPAPDRGFVGVIAGFASICVNGAEIHFAGNVPVFVDGVPRSASTLAIGQMVTVSAARRDGELHAARIEVLHSVVGPVESIQPESGMLIVLGQTLRVGAKAKALAGALGQLKAGDHVAASGSRLANGDVLLTRLERRTASENVSLMGVLQQSRDGTLMIGAQPVLLPQNEKVLVEPGGGGREIQIRGTLKNGVLQADSLSSEPRFNFGFPVRRIDLQGYLHYREREGGGRVNVSGADVVLRDIPLPVEGSRVHVEATLDGEGRLLGENLRSDRPPRPDSVAPIPQRSVDRNLDLPANLPNAPDAPNGTGTTRNENSSRTPPGDPSRPATPVTPVTIRPDLPRPELLRPELLRPERPRPSR